MPTSNEPAQPVDREHIDNLLGLCRVDPNVFIEFVGGYKQGTLHQEIQSIWSNYPSSYVELPRGHGKSIQTIYRCAWEIGNNPNKIIKFIGSVDDEAIKAVEAARDILESDKFRLVFPEIEPDPRNWGKSFLRVKRTEIAKDPTIEACGIFGNPGGRFDLGVFDDIFTLKNSVHSAITREQVKEQYRNTWMNMLKKNGTVIRVGTPWHINDGSADWRRNPKIKTVRYPCEGTHKSPWPEWWTGQMLEDMKMEIGDIAFARAYLLQPITGNELVFDPSLLLKYAYEFNQCPPGGEVIAAIDMAYRTENQPYKSRKTDPDWSVITVARILNDGQLYPFRMWRGRVTFPAFKLILKEMVDKYKVRTVLSEEVAAQIEINRQLSELLQTSKCHLAPLTRTKDKHLRAIEVQGVLQRGELHLPRDGDEITKEFLPMYMEMCDFPVGDYDDTVDTIIDLMKRALQVSGRDNGGVLYRGREGPINVFSFDDIVRESDRAEGERKRKEELRLLELGVTNDGEYWG